MKLEQFWHLLAARKDQNNDNRERWWYYTGTFWHCSVVFGANRCNHWSWSLARRDFTLVRSYQISSRHLFELNTREFPECTKFTTLYLLDKTLLSSYSSILGDIWLWVGVPWASSALVVPLPGQPTLSLSSPVGREGRLQRPLLRDRRGGAALVLHRRFLWYIPDFFFFFIAI